MVRLGLTLCAVLPALSDSFLTIHSIPSSLKCGAKVPKFSFSKKHVPRNLYSDDADDEEVVCKDDEWKVGNVEKDFSNLRHAINKAEEEGLRNMQNRIHQLEYVAQIRRSIRTDITKFIGLPALSSLLLTASIQKSTKLATSVKGLANCHFYLLLTGLPVALWVYTRLRESSFNFNKNNNSVSDDLDAQQLLPDAAEGIIGDDHLTRQETVSDDDIQTNVALLDQWMSAVLLTSSCLCGLSSSSQPVMTASTRMISRLGVLASLHQFPLLQFRLLLNDDADNKSSSQSKRLLTFLTRNLYTPWFVAIEFSLLMAECSLRIQVITFTLVGAFVMIATPRLLALKPKRDYEILSVRHWVPILRPIVTAGIIGSLIRYHWRATDWAYAWSIIQASNQYLHLTDVLLIAMNWLGTRKADMLKILVIGLAWACPLTHIRVLARNLRVQYTHDYPMTPENADIWSNPDHMEWRWRLEWKPPRRLSTVIRQARKNLVYKLARSGTVQEKVRLDLAGSRQSASRENDVNIVQRLAEDARSGRTLEFVDRDDWKPRALAEQARRHALDYERGSYDDPLGVAVQQTLGVGLGFEVDHMRSLDPGETASPRRLQARAAKSALVRAQQVRNATQAKEILNEIEDPVVRDAKAREMRDKGDRVVEWMGEQLSELIPVDNEGGRKKVDIEDMAQRIDKYTPKFRKTGPNQYTMETLGGQIHSPVVDALMRDYYAGGGATRKPTTEIGLDPTGVLNDDEFAEALKRQIINGTDTDPDSTYLA